MQLLIAIDGRCLFREELWVMLVEKAFAKFMGTYASLVC
jgi:hypothetical protein